MLTIVQGALGGALSVIGWGTLNTCKLSADLHSFPCQYENRQTQRTFLESSAIGTDNVTLSSTWRMRWEAHG